MIPGERYLTEGAKQRRLDIYVRDELPYLDYADTLKFYRTKAVNFAKKDRAFLACNDRYFLLTGIMGRNDALHPWLFNRCREVEANPDGYLDLWARFHYKSTIVTFAGALQEIVRNPDITICILSATRDISRAFLLQIQQEIENNELLRDTFDDVFWANPKTEAARWSRERGLVVKRKSNPKEATIEAWGLIDGQPTSRHYGLLIYDDVVTQDLVTNPEVIKKVTERWELSDNLGTHRLARKWHLGTRYHFGDTYGVILESKRLKERIYPATDNGEMDGAPVLLTPKRWAQIKDTQRITCAAQMLLNPIAGNEQTFRSEWFRSYDVRPTVLNIYIMVDPSKGNGPRTDRTAIAVVGVDVAGNRYLLDGVRHRMPLSERWTHLKRLWLKWKDAIGVQSIKVGYERYGMQTDDEVIREWQQRDGVVFALEELNTPRQGGHSKDDRIRRLEPDFRNGRFFLPAVVYHPNVRDDRGDAGDEGRCYWRVYTQAEHEAAVKNGGAPHNIGQVVYRPYRGMTKAQKLATDTDQGYRVVNCIKAIDEERKVYDLTRELMEEMRLHPAAPKDDLVDAVSRIYDLVPVKAEQWESTKIDAPVFEDT